MCNTWSVRKCKLRINKLCYYHPGQDIAAKGVIDFNLLTCAIETEANNTKDARKFRIVILKSDKIFLFQANTNENMKDWVLKIQKQIAGSDGFLRHITKVALQPYFWRRDRISSDAFFNNAQTGDLVLFRTMGYGGAMQRFFTCSTTDHIGLALRFASGDLYLFESLGRHV